MTRVTDNDHPELVELPVEDVLDLHPFLPRDTKALVRHYLDLAVEQGFEQVRIIHGKGTGIQRRIVWSQLEKHPRVECFGDAGSWGATWVRLS